MEIARSVVVTGSGQVLGAEMARAAWTRDAAAVTIADVSDATHEIANEVDGTAVQADLVTDTGLLTQVGNDIRTCVADAVGLGAIATLRPTHAHTAFSAAAPKQGTAHGPVLW